MNLSMDHTLTKNSLMTPILAMQFVDRYIKPHTSVYGQMPKFLGFSIKDRWITIVDHNGKLVHKYSDVMFSQYGVLILEAFIDISQGQTGLFPVNTYYHYYVETYLTKERLSAVQSELKKITFE